MKFKVSFLVFWVLYHDIYLEPPEFSRVQTSYQEPGSAVSKTHELITCLYYHKYMPENGGSNCSGISTVFSLWRCGRSRKANWPAQVPDGLTAERRHHIVKPLCLGCLQQHFVPCESMWHEDEETRLKRTAVNWILHQTALESLNW